MSFVHAELLFIGEDRKSAWRGPADIQTIPRVGENVVFTEHFCKIRELPTDYMWQVKHVVHMCLDEIDEGMPLIYLEWKSDEGDFQ